MYKITCKLNKKPLKSKFLFSASYLGNYSNSRNIWKAKPSALNRQSEGLYTHTCLGTVNTHFKTVEKMGKKTCLDLSVYFLPSLNKYIYFLCFLFSLSCQYLLFLAIISGFFSGTSLFFYMRVHVQNKAGIKPRPQSFVF